MPITLSYILIMDIETGIRKWAALWNFAVWCKTQITETSRKMSNKTHRNGVLPFLSLSCVAVTSYHLSAHLLSTLQMCCCTLNCFTFITAWDDKEFYLWFVILILAINYFIVGTLELDSMLRCLRNWRFIITVSYTHLTLPTIYSV